MNKNEVETNNEAVPSCIDGLVSMNVGNLRQMISNLNDDTKIRIMGCPNMDLGWCEFIDGDLEMYPVSS